MVSILRLQLTHNERKEYHTKDYAKYFDVVQTPKQGIKVAPKVEAMKAEMRNYGYFALLSNDVKEPFEALSLYRSQDIVEKGFGNLIEVFQAPESGKIIGEVTKKQKELFQSLGITPPS